MFATLSKIKSWNCADGLLGFFPRKKARASIQFDLSLDDDATCGGTRSPKANDGAAPGCCHSDIWASIIFSSSCVSLNRAPLHHRAGRGSGSAGAARNRIENPPLLGTPLSNKFHNS